MTDTERYDVVEDLESMLVPISEVRPDPANAREHPDKNLQAIADSLNRFGQRTPIVVQVRDEGGDVIRKGNGTWHAAKDILEWTHIAAIFIEESDTTASAYAIADNRTGELAEWDTEALEQTLSDLDVEFDLAELGFTDDDLEQMEFSVDFGDAAGVDTDDTDGDAPDAETNRAEQLREEWGVERGDVFEAGDHHIVCADGTDPGVYRDLVDSAAFAVTSPPYNAGNIAEISGNTHTSESKYEKSGQDDDLDRDEYVSLLSDLTASALSACKYLVVNIQMLADNKRAVIEYLHAWREHVADVAIWEKGTAQPAYIDNVMNARFELLVFFGPEGASRAIPTADFRGDVGNVVEIGGQRQNEYADAHAATFPVELPEWIIGNFTQREHVIVDPCAGTGTTLIAAQETGRRAVIGDISPEYVAVTLDRVDKWGLDVNKCD